MSLILKNESNFIPAPEGVHDAVCVDVVDLGMVETTWKGKTKQTHKVRIAWELDKEMPADEKTGEKKGRFIAMGRYTLSMDVKSNLRKMLKVWRGRDFSKEEMAGFDLEKIVGIPCQLVLTHSESNEGKTFANIQSVLKAGDKKLSASGKYKRVKDREGYEPPSLKEASHDSDEDENDDIPF
jgi:hypothetical protein